MEVPSGTYQELIDEISDLRQRIHEWEQPESGRKRFNDACRESEEKFRTIFNCASDGILIADVATKKFVEGNPAICSLLGYTKQEIEHLTIYDIHPPQDIPAVFAELEKQITGEKVLAEDLPVVRKDGSIFYADICASPAHIGGVPCLLGVFRDITERKLAGETLRESETKLQAIFNTVGTGIVIIDKETERIIEANKTASEMTGLSKERIIGQICHSLICPAQVGKCPVKDLGQRVDNSEKKLLHADGYQKEILKTVYPITIKGRDCYVESFIDITDRKLIERALRESEERYRALVENANDIVFRTDPTGHLTFFNPAALRITGFEEKEIIGRHFLTLIRPDKREDAKNYFVHQFAEGTPNTYSEYPVIAKYGREIWVGQNTQMIFQDGKVTAFQAVARDITDRKLAEEALKESENRYRELSIVDDLTQLYNSRHFHVQLKIELDRANRYELPLTLLLLDLDNFKTFNDAYGHVEGDQVLWRLGQVIKRCLRETDLPYRYGGEEFTILLPMTTSVDGAVIAERIRTKFKEETFTPTPGQDVHMTVSIGLAQYKPQEEMKAFVHRVDQLMYQVKKSGKDKVCSGS